MIVYKIDKQPNAKANTYIREMAAVLAEIPATLQTLQEVISQQEAAISSPSINNFRDELQRVINEAITLTRTISDSSQSLVSASDQAAKHLLAIEEHFGAVLRDKTSQVAQAQPQQVS